MVRFDDKVYARQVVPPVTAGVTWHVAQMQLCY